MNYEYASRDLSKCYGAPIVMSLPYFMDAPDFLRDLDHHQFVNNKNKNVIWNFLHGISCLFQGFDDEVSQQERC